ncbi:MAG: hypothetical protein AB7S75_07790 [Desulfococcaceae bacterium]
MKTYEDEKIECALLFLRDIKKSLNDDDKIRINVVMEILKCGFEKEVPAALMNICRYCGKSFRSDSGFCSFDLMPFAATAPCCIWPGICPEWMDGKCSWFVCSECSNRPYLLGTSENTGTDPEFEK